MGQLSPVLRSVAGGRLLFYCPGCESAHIVRVVGDEHPRWGYNDNPDRPTFTPSILVTYNGPDADTRDADGDRAPSRICHSFVTDGRIQFLGDSSHELAAQTVDLPPLPDHLRDMPA